MVKQSFISIVLITITAVGCGKSEFAEGESKTQAYSVSVRAPSADSSAQPTGGANSESSTPSTSTTVETGKEGEGDDESKTECAKLTGVKTEHVKVSGSEKNIIISKDDVLSFKVTGNQNILTVDLKSEPVESEVKAICIFIAGNKNHLKLDIANHVGAIFIVARGNQAQVDISTLKGSVIDKIEMDAKGNKGQLAVTGEGTFPCDKNNTSISCK